MKAPLETRLCLTKDYSTCMPDQKHHKERVKGGKSRTVRTTKPTRKRFGAPYVRSPAQHLSARDAYRLAVDACANPFSFGVHGPHRERRSPRRYAQQIEFRLEDVLVQIHWE